MCDPCRITSRGSHCLPSYHNTSTDNVDAGVPIRSQRYVGSYNCAGSSEKAIRLFNIGPASATVAQR